MAMAAPPPQQLEEATASPVAGVTLRMIKVLRAHAHVTGQHSVAVQSRTGTRVLRDADAPIASTHAGAGTVFELAARLAHGARRHARARAHCISLHATGGTSIICYHQLQLSPVVRRRPAAAPRRSWEPPE